MASIVLNQGYVLIYPNGNQGTLSVNNLKPAQWGTILGVNDLCENYVVNDKVFFYFGESVLIQQEQYGEAVNNAFYIINEKDILFKQS
jgi:hypothetical protein